MNSNQITQLQEHFKENKARLTELENLNKTVNEVKTQIVSFKTYLFEDNRKCKSEIGDLIKSRFSQLSTQHYQRNDNTIAIQMVHL